jgi:hypothetical protein
MSAWLLALSNVSNSKTALQEQCRRTRLEYAEKQKREAYRLIRKSMKAGMPYCAKELAEANGRKSPMAVRQRLEEMAVIGSVEKIVLAGLGNKQRFLWITKTQEKRA